MNSMLPNAAIQATAFVAGAAVMILELVGIRMFAPFLGTSIIVWTCMIGIVMSSLSLGYFLGGKITNKHTSIHTLAHAILLAGVLVLLTALIQEMILTLFSETMLLTKAAIFSSIVLFGPANIVFGTVSPIAVQLYFNTNKQAGSSSGTIYAVSTLGSIAGTFGAGLVLIPRVGLFELLLAVTCVLLLCGSALLLFKAPKAKPYTFAIVIILCAVIWTQKEALQRYTEEGYYNGETISDTNTKYARVRIWETQLWGNPVRIFMDWQSTMYTDPKKANALAIPYTRYYRLAEHFMPEFKNTLALGGAGYTFPKYFLAAYPEKYIDVVEIDPDLLPLAKKYFGFTPTSHFQSITEDARTYINKTEKRYDVIYADAFSKDTVVPFHLTTREVMQRMSEVLTEEGLLIMNMIGGTEGRNSAYFRMQYHTLKNVFPQVYAFEVSPGGSYQNIMLVALKTQTPVALTSTDRTLQSYLKNRYTKPVPKSIILTDNFAPVEYASLSVITCLRNGSKDPACR